MYCGKGGLTPPLHPVKVYLDYPAKPDLVVPLITFPKMAIYHLRLKIIKRSEGQNVIAASAYISGEELEDEREKKTFSYSHKTGIDFTCILTPDNAPSWMKNRQELWNAIEATEKRKDARLARNFNIALPKELTPDQNKFLALKFIREEFVDKGMVADVAFHNLDSHNPHFHMIVTMRKITPEGFGLKMREWDSRQWLLDKREAWANHVNSALFSLDIKEQVSHLSLEKQGIIERMPQIHLGPKLFNLMKKAENPEELRKQFERIDLYESINDINRQLALDYQKVIQLEGELSEEEEERRQQQEEEARQEGIGLDKATPEELARCAAYWRSKNEMERLASEKAQRERIERAERERITREKAEVEAEAKLKERLAREKADQEKAEAMVAPAKEKEAQEKTLIRRQRALVIGERLCRPFISSVDALFSDRSKVLQGKKYTISFQGGEVDIAANDGRGTLIKYCVLFPEGERLRSLSPQLANEDLEKLEEIANKMEATAQQLGQSSERDQSSKNRGRKRN